MNRFDFLNTCCAIAAVPAAFEGPKSVAGLNVPDSALSREAAATARACEPIEIFNHSLRAFFFAELIARAKGLAHDVEAVFVASILHDTGLSPAYMSQDRRFEVDSANLAREIAGRHGVERARADAIWDAVSLHDQGEIARWKSTEVMLVNAGVVADFGGSLNLMKRDDVAAVLESAPRTGFIPVFLDAVVVVAKRKPQATGNSFVTDVGYRMIPGFHLENFCDEVKTDPFAGYLAPLRPDGLQHLFESRPRSDSREPREAL
ncbi:MAG: HD domain-containing protein [Candidatus Cybelea sp.]